MRLHMRERGVSSFIFSSTTHGEISVRRAREFSVKVQTVVRVNESEDFFFLLYEKTSIHILPPYHICACSQHCWTVSVHPFISCVLCFPHTLYNSLMQQARKITEIDIDRNIHISFSLSFRVFVQHFLIVVSVFVGCTSFSKNSVCSTLLAHFAGSHSVCFFTVGTICFFFGVAM